MWSRTSGATTARITGRLQSLAARVRCRALDHTPRSAGAAAQLAGRLLVYMVAMRADRSTLAGIALLCFANLLLSILVTRLFSATMFYHFTFVAVGLAMFGIAASGVYVFLHEQRFATDLPGHLARYSRRFAMATLLAVIFILANPIFGSGTIPAWSSRVFWQLVLLIGVTALPFFFAGVVVSLALTFFRDNVNRVYFWDLVGAAVAALTAGLILALVGGPTAVIVCAAAALGAASLFDRGGRARWLAPALGVGLVLVNVIYPVVKVGSVKWEGEIAFEHWNTFSRVTVDTGQMIKIDAGAATVIHDLRNARPDLYQKEISALALAVFAPPPDDVLIIGPGGGRDVLFALSAGAKHITGVEINPIIGEKIMQERYLAFSGGLYRDPRVEIVIDEGRSFIRRQDKKFDMIQASLVDTWAASGAGAFALTENTLYTIEAFQDYFAHLTDRGVVTMTRFFGGVDGQGVAESPRLIVLVAGALETLGIKPGQTRKHMFFAISKIEPQGTMVAKRTPFTPDELARLEAGAAAADLVVLLSPNTDGSSQLERYVDAGAWSAVVRAARDELRPPTDDWPFFFYYKKFGRLLELKGKTIADPDLWILVSLGSVVTLALFFVILPLVLRVVQGGGPRRTESSSTQLAVLGYFALVGFAFMLVEIALLQRFSLFLGHPSYSLVVILFVVLLSTAVGSSISGRFEEARLGKILLIAGAALGVAVSIYGLVLGDLLRSMISIPLTLRIFITGMLVAPLGLLMGTMVPSMVRILGRAGSTLVPWGWGVNGAASVFGTVAATVMALYTGFTATFIVGGLCYLLAGALGRIAARRYDGAPAAPARATAPAPR